MMVCHKIVSRYIHIEFAIILTLFIWARIDRVNHKKAALRGGFFVIRRVKPLTSYRFFHRRQRQEMFSFFFDYLFYCLMLPGRN